MTVPGAGGDPGPCREGSLLRRGDVIGKPIQGHLHCVPVVMTAIVDPEQNGIKPGDPRRPLIDP